MKRNHLLLFLILFFSFLVRIYQLGTLPISLHGDEVGVGYNAYALLKSGIDEYGIPWPIVFRADVAPFIFYATIPSVYVFGLTEFSTRFPSVVVGMISLVAFYFAIKKLMSEKIALISTLLFSFSPAHIQISRIVHDASYGLMLQLFAALLFLIGKNGKRVFVLLSFIFFGLSFYSYHSPRLTSPLLLAGLLFIFKSEMRRIKKTILYGFILFALTIIPISVDFLSKPVSETRFAGISIFTREDTSIPLTPLYFIKLIPPFIQNYANQFNPYFLFFDTSSMRYFNVSKVGLVYWWEIILIPIGAFFIFKHDKKQSLLIFWWVAISVIPGSLTRGNPNAGRIFMLIPMLSILSGLGVLKLIEKIKHKKDACIFLSLIGIGSFLFFLHQYFIDSRFRFAPQWNYGAKEMAQKVLRVENEYDKIVITSQIRQGYIYILFYGKKDPRWLIDQPNIKRNSFIGYNSFGKYEFREIDWQKDKEKENTLLVGPIKELPQTIPSLYNLIDPENKIVWRIMNTVL